MPVFTDALIGDTLHLSAEEFGAYCLLLFATWRNNGEALPDDVAELSQICRVTPARWRTRMRSKLVRFFNVGDGYWHQKRLEKEWDNVQRKVEANRANGARGGRPREPNGNPPVNPTGTEGIPNGNPTGTQTEPIQSQSQKQLASNLETDSLPREWAERVRADRANAGMPEIDLQNEWTKFISKIETTPTIGRWIGWALKARPPSAEKEPNGAGVLPEPPWPQRCRSWVDGYKWLTVWGPKPGEQGCWAPAELVEKSVADRDRRNREKKSA